MLEDDDEAYDDSDRNWWHNVRTFESRWDPPTTPTPVEPSIDALLRYVATMSQAPVASTGELPVAALVA